MEVTVASRSDVGRVRTNNEDNFLVDGAIGLYVVADGMGGHNAGEVASLNACEIIHRELSINSKARDKFQETGRSSDAKSVRKVVEQAMSTACKEIHRQSIDNPEHSGMGTTVTLIYMIGHDKGILGHVGDSRLFVHRAGHIHQLSEDHTFVNELLKRGAITKAQAKNHPQGNVLSRAMGVQPSVPVDTMIFDIDPGDTFLLCSDGLYNYYPDSEEIATDLSNPDLQGGLDVLIDRALERGGHDNTTGIALRIGGLSTDNPLAAERRIAILKRIPIFSHLTYNELVKVVGLTHLERVPAGETFITEGERGDDFYVVLAGEVTVEKGGEVLTTLKPGAHLGEMAMIDNARRSATIRAATDVNLLVMRREEFFGVIRTEPVVATKLLWSFVQVLSSRLRETNEALQGARQELSDQDDDVLEIFIDEE